MAYDVELADRLREILTPEPGVTEMRMFGGLAFLIGGHMVVTASSRGGIMLPVDPADTDALVTDPLASRFVMRGREMDGWLHVGIGADTTDDELARWVEHGLRRARSLPPA